MAWARNPEAWVQVGLGLEKTLDPSPKPLSISCAIGGIDAPISDAWLENSSAWLGFASVADFVICHCRSSSRRRGGGIGRQQHQQQQQKEYNKDQQLLEITIGAGDMKYSHLDPWHYNAYVSDEGRETPPVWKIAPATTE